MTPQSEIQPFRYGPFSVQDVYGFAAAFLVPAGVFVDLGLGGFSVPGPGVWTLAVSAGPSPVTVEGPELVSESVPRAVVEAREERVAFGFEESEAFIEEGCPEEFRVPWTAVAVGHDVVAG